MFQARQFLNQSHSGGLTGGISDQSEVAKYVQKWGPMLEGIEDELPSFSPAGHGKYVKAVAAFMLESQMQAMLRLNEDTRAISVGPFMKYVFPVIRRSAIRLVATSIASVQPMMGPVGGVAFYRPRYASDKGGITAGSEINKTFNKWYSSNFIDGELVFTGDAIGVAANATLKWPRVLPGTLSVTEAGAIIGTDNGLGALTALSGSLTGGVGTVNYQTGLVNLTFGTAPAAGVEVKIEYRYDNELNSRIPEVQLDIEILQIRAESRKLKS